MFMFILFAILGYCVFAPPLGNGRIVAMVVFVVLMVLWALQGTGTISVPHGGGKW